MVTKSEKSEHARALSELGASKGGKARAAALSPEQRQEIARKAAEKRWGRRFPVLPRATHSGILKIGEMVIPCAVLDDGTRVLSERGVTKALGGKRGGAHWRRMKESGGGAHLPVYLSANNLRSFIDDELGAALSRPIVYTPVESGGYAHGVNAELLPKICNVLLKARDADVLTGPQEKFAAVADVIVRGLAEVGIIALVDEATGYQHVRDRLALQAILDRFLRQELAAWAKRFPDEFYQQIFRLRGWQWKGMKINRPQVVAAYTKDFVYKRLAPGILKQLESRNPIDDSGNRRAKHHQWLTEDVGHPALAQHLYAVIGFMRVASSWEQLKSMLNRAFPKKGTTLELPFPIPDAENR